MADATLITTVPLDVVQINRAFEALSSIVVSKLPWPGRVANPERVKLMERALRDSGPKEGPWSEVVHLLQLAAIGLAYDHAIHFTDGRIKTPFDGLDAATLAHRRLFAGGAWLNAPAVSTILKGAVELAERL
jgi:hypothetical protein